MSQAVGPLSFPGGGQGEDSLQVPWQLFICQAFRARSRVKEADAGVPGQFEAACKRVSPELLRRPLFLLLLYVVTGEIASCGQTRSKCATEMHERDASSGATLAGENCLAQE